MEKNRHIVLTEDQIKEILSRDFGVEIKGGLRFQLSRVRGELRIEWDVAAPEVVSYLDGGNVMEK